LTAWQAAAAAALFGAALNGGETEFAAWQWRCGVTAPPGPFAALALTPEMFDACARPHFSDFRLTVAGGSEVPYVIASERDSVKEFEVKGRELNREQPDAETKRLTVDFEVATLKNRLVVATSGENFLRRVRVEGSHDQQTWATLLEDGLVAAVAGQRFETVDLGSDNNYRFIRVTVRKMAEEEAAPDFEAVRCWRRVVKTAEPIVRRCTVVGGQVEYTRDGGRRVSTASIDFTYRHLPITALRLVLAGAPERVFRRNCRVFGRDSLTHMEKVRFETGEKAGERPVDTPWMQAGTGTIARDIEGRASLTLAVEAPYRYVKIEIENGDNPPLELAAVEGLYHAKYAVFQPAGQKLFTAYFGNDEARVPQYEVEALAEVDLKLVPKAEAEALVAQDPKSEKESPEGQTFVWVLMALSALAALALLWRSAKLGPAPEPARKTPAAPPGGAA